MRRVKFRVAVLMVLAGLSSTGLTEEYPSADGFLGESLFPSEPLYAERIGRSIEGSLRKSYQGKLILRDAHPKAHGCPQARFVVSDSLPARFQAGVLQAGAEYEASVRFSNGNSDASRADSKGDTRGMAIKLHEVAGQKLLAGVENGQSQDFLLMSFPAFFVNEPKAYAEFFETINGDEKWKLLTLPFKFGWRGTVNALKMLNTKIDHPLGQRYWSVVPYQLGQGDSRVAVKYSAKPCGAPPADVFDESDEDYLRKAMQLTLNSGGACMAFMVQERQGNQQIEDVVTEWSEDEAPFIEVAQLKFDSQQFDTPDQMQACEAMSFNPWHSLPAHKPLGSVNRIRKSVYERISRLRAASM